MHSKRSIVNKLKIKVLFTYKFINIIIIFLFNYKLSIIKIFIFLEYMLYKATRPHFNMDLIFRDKESGDYLFFEKNTLWS